MFFKFLTLLKTRISHRIFIFRKLTNNNRIYILRKNVISKDHFIQRRLHSCCLRVQEKKIYTKNSMYKIIMIKICLLKLRCLQFNLWRILVTEKFLYIYIPNVEMMCVNVEILLLTSNGGLPTSKVYIKQPRLHTSDSRPWGLRVAISLENNINSLSQEFHQC